MLPATCAYFGGMCVLAVTAGMGPRHYELIHEYDCPGIAIYFDFWHLYDSPKPYRNRNSVCLFEMDMGSPMRRHISKDQGWAASIKQYALYVRGMSSVYNYDYTYVRSSSSMARLAHPARELREACNPYYAGVDRRPRLLSVSRA